MCAWGKICWQCILCLSVLGCAQIAEGVEEGRFIGWLGETHRSIHPASKDLAEVSSTPSQSPWVEVISWSPRAFVYHNLLSEQECAHVIRTAAPQMKRSTVVGHNASSVLDDIRTSYGTFIKRLQDTVIERVEEKVANWTRLPISHQEDLQVLHYVDGQKYGAHYDSLHSNSDNPRVATVLIYLTDVQDGGETAFPKSNKWASPERGKQLDANFSDCAKGHVAYPPRRGDALLFFSLHSNGTQDAMSMHTGCPVGKGSTKWTATFWIHVEPFRPEAFKRPLPSEIPKDPGICEDLNANCAAWAAVGECAKNAGYMVGKDSSSPGQCRAACGDCEKCAPRDRACYKRNRVKAGYLVLAEPLPEVA